jgi:hypothetical protein
MRRLSLFASVALIALLVAAPAVDARPASPFTGAWVGTDPAPPNGDGSTLYLTISGGATARLTFIDTYGSICVREGAPTVVFTSGLTGTVAGNTLDAVFVRARCGPVAFDWLVGAPATWWYDAATDTITDGFAVWHRA